MRRNLRCLLLSLLVLVAGLAPAAALEGAPRLFEYGVKGGISLPSFFWTGDDGWNQVTMFAFQTEAYAYGCLNLSPSFGVVLEAGYRGKGCSVDASDGYLHWYMDYLELPLWAKWSAREGEDFCAYGGLGGYAAWFLGGRYDFSTGVSSLDGSGSLSTGAADDPTVVRPFDCGLLLVAGLEAKRLILELRFSVGVLNSLDFTPPSEFGGSRGALNSGIDLLVGYRL